VGRCTVFERVGVVDARAAFGEHRYITCWEFESKIGSRGGLEVDPVPGQTLARNEKIKETKSWKGDTKGRPTGLDIIVEELPFEQRRQGHNNPGIMQRR